MDFLSSNSSRPTKITSLISIQLINGGSNRINFRRMKKTSKHHLQEFIAVKSRRPSLDFIIEQKTQRFYPFSYVFVFFYSKTKHYQFLFIYLFIFLSFEAFIQRYFEMLWKLDVLRILKTISKFYKIQEKLLKDNCEEICFQ